MKMAKRIVYHVMTSDDGWKVKKERAQRASARNQQRGRPSRSHAI